MPYTKNVPPLSYSSPDGVQVHYTQHGDTSNPALVFIPGWGGERWIWNRQVEKFSNDYHCILIDFPGFGGTKLSTLPASVDYIANLLALTLEDIGISNCYAIGHSFGGVLALTLAGIKPGLVRKVIGVDSFTYLSFYPKVADDVIATIAAGFHNDFRQACLDISAEHFIDTSDPDLKSRVRQAMCDSDPAVGTAIMEIFLAWDLKEHVQKFEGPISSIVAHDTYEKEAFEKEFSNAIAIDTVQDSGHFIMLDQTEMLNAAISKYL